MTSPSDFNTPGRIIRTAMDNAGLLAEGEDPSPEQFAKYMNRLNDLINLWQIRGLKLWLNRIMNLSIVAGTSTYTISPKEMRIIEGYYLDSNQLPRPLTPLGWNEWNMLPHALSGAVNSFFYDKQLSTGVLHLWQVPDANAATGSCQFLVQDPVANVVSLTDTMAFPTEWYMALHWGLADEICTGQPEPIVQRCGQRAAMYLEALEGWDVEDASTKFQPSTIEQRSSFR